MGDSTGSMFYLFAIIIVLYIIGMSIYCGISYLKKRRNRR